MPARHRVTFVVGSAVFVAGSALWIVFDHSWEAFIVGGLLVGSLAWVWGLSFAVRPSKAGTFALVLTDTALASPAGSLQWDQIERVRLARTHPMAGNLRALEIEPRELSAIRWSSPLMRVTARSGVKLGFAPLRILELNIDRSLEELVAEFEARAGRRLLVPPPASPPDVGLRQ